ncbi:MAG: hypothetical protein LAT55_09100 [Opitutales bacterium]|nr:hypothetical protein [Opitutales bacterium]
MKSSEKLKESISCLSNMSDILMREGELDFAQSVQDVIHAGRTIQDSDEALKEMSFLYRSMHGGAGSFSDYFIWRDNFDDRVEANKEFEILSQRLWELLGNNHSTDQP